MQHILQDLSAPSLVAAIEENLFATFATMHKWPRAEVHDETELWWSMTDIPFSLFNSILRAKLVPERIDAVIQSITAKAISRNVPLLWWTGPATQPADLGVHLEGHGFISDGQLPGMAVDLANLNQNRPMPTGFTIERVTDDANLMKWSQVCAQGFGMPDFTANGLYNFVRYADPNTMQAYLGWRNSQPVATSLLVLAAGVAGIYNVATIQGARRQGFGTLLTLAPLHDARDRKYRIAILQASSIGAPVYRSLGFQEYCKIGQYEWSPEQKQGAG